MLSEEALVFLAALTGLGLLTLGVLDQIWPTRSKHRVPPRRRVLDRRRAGTPPRRAPRPERTEPVAPAMPQNAEELGSLERAEELLAAMPPEALRLGRREDVDTRLWKTYVTLGLHYIEDQKFEEALDPLFDALRLAVGEQQPQTRSALLRAYAGIVTMRSEEILVLVGRGETAVAEVQADKLWTTLKNGIDHGLSQDDMAELLECARSLFAQVRGRAGREAEGGEGS